MKYQKAQDLFPGRLLEEMQRYAEGCVIYIPKREGKRRAWGEATGAREQRLLRDAQIRSDYKEGASLDVLSKRYFLSVESIKKIIYSH
jgi:Mor family transcriptional regulator